MSDLMIGRVEGYVGGVGVPKSKMPSHIFRARCPTFVSCITAAVAAGGAGGTRSASAAHSISARSVLILSGATVGKLCNSSDSFAATSIPLPGVALVGWFVVGEGVVGGLE